MANLDRVLGAIISNVARGRSQGDAAVVELAKAYLADDVLKSFPVPRMSLDEVVIELKVGISSMTPPGLTQDGRRQLIESLDSTLSSLPDREAALGEVMGREATPARQLWAAQRSARFARISSLLPETGEVDAERVASEVASIARENLTSLMSDPRTGPNASRNKEIVERLAGGLALRVSRDARQAIEQALKTAASRPEGLDILVTASELQNVPPDKVSTVRMVLRESDREWTQLESEGKTVNRLIPR